MKRLYRLTLLTALIAVLGLNYAKAVVLPDVKVSGRIAPGDVRVFVKDSTYSIQKSLVVGGTLIIEPGTTVYFYPNSRIIDSAGGRILADGYAKATNNIYPQTWNPGLTPPNAGNPKNWRGFADLNYFLWSQSAPTADATVLVQTNTANKELTVNAAKSNIIYNVVLDTLSRKLRNLGHNPDGTPAYTYDDNGNQVALNALNIYNNTVSPPTGRYAIVSFEQALMFIASRLNSDPNNDIVLQTNPWQRIAGKSPNIVASQILFQGQPVNNSSAEWGHILVLPGARAAFFRNAKFDNMKKDSSVDRVNLYATAAGTSFGGDKTNYTAMNRRMNILTNGAGGAISTFASRTWLVDCQFTNNTARNRGGALAILQSPKGFNSPSFNNYDPNALILNPLANYNALTSSGTDVSKYYPLGENPNIVNRDGSVSDINYNSTKTRSNVLAIDYIDEVTAEPFLTPNDRAVFDDGRTAVYLGRIRNLSFTNNSVLLANNIIKTDANGNTIVSSDLDNPASNLQTTGNHAFGGAVYIAGEDGAEESKLEIGLGVNHSIKIGGVVTNFAKRDVMTFTGNTANNYQTAGSTAGARGGAIYAGKYTSLIVAGKFISNSTNVPQIAKISVNNQGAYSLGGAIYTENTFGRLQIVGEPARDADNNSTEFTSNKAGAGGAVYVDGNTDPTVSPVVGGSDATLNTRDMGFNILFSNNSAVSNGGAILTKRNAILNGAGGVDGTELIGYGGKYPIRFKNNTAGYSGGAIEFHIPNAAPLLPNQRNVYMSRIVFANNTVGDNIAEANKTLIRGGGAIYSLSADLNVVRGCEFSNNTVTNGNGGAICLVNPTTTTKRFFVSDIDAMSYGNPTYPTIATSYASGDGVFTYSKAINYPPDVRMLTRFIGNTINVDDNIVASQSGTGTTQVGQGTVATTERLMSTFWTDVNNGYAVGTNGIIVKFTNGGSTWTYLKSGTNFRLNKVWFTNSTNGYAVGEQGTFLNTTDAGTTWTNVVTSPSVGTNEINDIFFVGTQYGYAVTNSGWLYRLIPGSLPATTWSGNQVETANLKSIYVLSPNSTNGVGFIVGDNKTILKTTNGGGAWSAIAVVNPSITFNRVSFINTTSGYIVGNSGTYLKTTNGGDAWTTETSLSTSDLLAVQFITNKTGFATSRSGEVFMSTDGGTNWTKSNPSLNSLYDISFPSSSVGFIVGDLGLLLKTMDGGNTWAQVLPSDKAYVDVVRYHQEVNLPENGVGLGGAIYVLDKVTLDRVGREDTISFNRVRMQNNKSFTGAAVYSDNYDLKLIFNKSLITGNVANSTVGATQNAILGPVVKDSKGKITNNKASSDLVGAVIYGEVQGPLPNSLYSVNSNVIDANTARFLIRLPDAPNAKGALSGTLGFGYGGTDTLRGNYWGATEANVNLSLDNGFGLGSAVEETFFVMADNTSNELPLVLGSSVLRDQGPFERGVTNQFNYTPIPKRNVVGNEDKADAVSIPEQYLMSGRMYDIYDKGTDIKTADYSKRRMSPIEDFAVGIPPSVLRYTNIGKTGLPSTGKYVRRFNRNPADTDAVNLDGTKKYPFVGKLLDEYRPDANGNNFHPIGEPLYLETTVDYTGLIENNNHDPNYANETVFFVINDNTGDFIRVNMKQVSETAPYQNVFRARVELIPDSSNRNTNPFIRRTYEGLYNLGTQKSLLDALRGNASNEDNSVLQGRRYQANPNEFGKVPNLFSNRPPLAGPYNYYAGERYRALPVDTGDVVRIISRTVLWKDSVVGAYNDGMSFKVSASNIAPYFTGNVIKLQSDTVVRYIASYDSVKKALAQYDTLKVVEFVNRIAVTEDRDYPGSYSGLKPEEGQGRDSIMSITAVDSNKYNDPRSILLPKQYTSLTYEWLTNPGSGVRNWLIADTVYAADKTGNATKLKDGALGYVVLKGHPSNPYVVPGGEPVTVKAWNYPPNYRTADSLLSIWGYPTRDKLTQGQMDTLNALNYVYSPYMNATQYSKTGERYLQQDSVNNGLLNSISYTFNMFAINVPPTFLDDDYNGGATNTILNSHNDTISINNPSVLTCGRTADGRVKANLTDKLRFQVDLNTDDEAEDAYAAKKNWNFVFGQTAYNFYNYVIGTKDGQGRPDSVTLDSAYLYIPDPNNSSNINIKTTIGVARPIWLDGAYLNKYDSDTDRDNFGNDFISKGQLNVRIDRNVALDLLKPAPQYNQALNTDTSFTVIVNDGHGGKAEKRLNVFINVQPQIVTQTLADATEGSEFNSIPNHSGSNGNGSQMIDSSAFTNATRIQVYDPNFGQAQNYELIYDNDKRDTIWIDPCYHEAGFWKVDALKALYGKLTPNWIKINSQSGILYGTPTVKDAPKQSKVIVLVHDADSLFALKAYDITVKPINHGPNLSYVPTPECVDLNAAYHDSIYVVDLDLLRDPDAVKEVINLSIVSPTSGLKLSQTTINGPINPDTVKVYLDSDNGFAALINQVDANGYLTVTIRISDAQGNDFLKTFKIKISGQTDFSVPMTISNSNGSFQKLVWGQSGSSVTPTTGDGSDGAPQGTLDAAYCETELPPYPVQDIFDARWTIVNTNGTLRSIYPTSVSQYQRWYCVIQPGAEGGNTNVYYPLTIKWNLNDVPNKTDKTKNPKGSSWILQDATSNGQEFRINMQTGDYCFQNTCGQPNAGYSFDKASGTFVISNSTVKSFVIFRDWNSDVETGTENTGTTGLTSVVPSIISTETNINFELTKAQNVEIQVVDVLGNVVATVANQNYSAGTHSITWNKTTEMASGSYVIKMVAGNNVSNLNVMLVK